jgi:hypothetical protein
VPTWERAGVPLSEHFEFGTAEDPSLNYCLWQYTPVVSAEDRYRAINLLLHSFEQAGLDERAYEFVDAVRDAVGPFRTVFGIKLIDGSLAWELYFYDYARRDRDVSINRTLDVLDRRLRCPVRVDDDLPYFMFSLDIDAPIIYGQRPLDRVHMYIGNPGSTVSSGISYEMTAAGVRLENFYFFFDAATQLEQAADKIRCSAVMNPHRIDFDAIFIPELRDCQTICVANKQANDCVYFSGIDVVQLLYFLRRFDYPSGLTEFVQSNRSLFDHLLFDVGIDYRLENGEIAYLKSGYYGVF